ncbi:MAG: MFS transporter [Promethearchaeota archaeon]
MAEDNLSLNNNEKPKFLTRSKKYLFGLFIFLAFMEILDTYTTMTPVLIVSSVQKELYMGGLGLTQQQADEAFAKTLAIASIGMYLGIFTRLFADITGRKIWLFITALGMGVGAFFVGMSNSVLTFTIGLFILYLFYSSDIWAIYVAEEAPKEKRGIYQNLVLIAGILGGVIGFIAMGIFITDEHQNWRMVMLIGGFGVILALFAFLLKETGPFQEINIKRKESGIPRVNPFKNLLKVFKGEHGKNVLPILIIMFIVGFTQSIGTMGETLLARHLGHDATTVLMALTIVWILIAYIIVGIGMDKFGRKPIKIISSIIGPIAIVFYILGLTVWGWTNLLILGSLNGIVLMAGQGILLPNKIAGYESVPTEIRGATASWMAFVRAIGNTMGLLAAAVLIKYLSLGWATLIITCTFLITIPVTLLWGKETKGIDMREV